MRKTERIDQVLIRLGHVTEPDVETAVEIQRERGGRIGRHLVDQGFLSEDQLFDGLVEQFRLPTINVDVEAVPSDLLERMPQRRLEENLIVPLAWNAGLGVLSVAVANPSDEAAIEEVRHAFGARKVRVSLAPDTVLEDLVTRLGGGRARQDGATVRVVAFPELFEPELADEPSVPDAGEVPVRRLLMVSSRPIRKNFLPTVLASERCDLLVASSAPDVAEALAKDVDAVLVADELADAFERWLRTDAIPAPDVEVIHFGSISGALVDNPAPYAALAASVRAGVQALAEYRCAAEGVSPAYALMAQDLEALAQRLRLGRLATDGVVLGLHLLMPVAPGTNIEPFRSFANSLEIAHRLRFPWPVETLLRHCLDLYLGKVDVGDVGADAGEASTAAQMLALVWFRHNLLDLESPERSQPSRADEAATLLRLRLRELAGRIAALDVVEAYLDQLSERDADPGAEQRRVLLVGDAGLRRALVPALGRIGCELDEVTDLSAAQRAVADVRPDAIVVSHQAFGDEVERLCRVLRIDRARLFVLTDESDPALVLNLLDIGVDDVFGPPHDFDLVAARIHRAMRSGSALRSTGAPDHLSARFEAISFIDLAQMLANGLKSVRVDLRRAEQEAVVFFEKGRPIHARCGTLAGPGAVYEVVAWEEDGEFSLHEVCDFPQPNVVESVESLLMEGVRLLDEGRA